MPGEQITFHYESDGGPTYVGGGRFSEQPRTFYLIAECDQWSDNKRLDFDKAAEAIRVHHQLRTGAIDMDEAAKIAGREWL